MRDLRDRVAKVLRDESLLPRFKQRELKRLEHEAKRDWITNHSYWWARDGISVVDIGLLSDADIAVGRLDPVPLDMVATLPTIKNPAANMDIGRSLCRLGFPFAVPKVTYDEGADSFSLEGNLTWFPIEGIFTRNIRTAGGTPGGTPIQYVETSSPGLRGQSGGPVFDIHGRIWGIQSRTTHIPLGFDPTIEVLGRKVTEHQFINLGWAVHPETLVATLNELGIAHNLSPE